MYDFLLHDVIRSRKFKERHYNGQKKEDVIRSRKSTERHYNGQKKEDVIRSRKFKERHYNGQKKEDVDFLLHLLSFVHCSVSP
jgi:hypothetical protein